MIYNITGTLFVRINICTKTFIGLKEAAVGLKGESQTRVNPNMLRIAEEYVQRLKDNKIPLVKTILYGSQARETSEPDSDIDILVVIKSLDKSIKTIIIDEAFDLSLQHKLNREIDMVREKLVKKICE